VEWVPSPFVLSSLVVFFPLPKKFFAPLRWLRYDFFLFLSGLGEECFRKFFVLVFFYFFFYGNKKLFTI